MMHGLERPKILPRSGIESQQTVAEETGAGTIGAIEIVSRGSQREIGDAALFIDRHPTPVVGPAYVLPGVFGPGIVTKFAGVRDGMKNPDHLARENVIGPNITWRGVVFFSGCRAQNQQVFEYPARGPGFNGTHCLRIAAQAFTQIDVAVIAKAVHRFAGAGIKRMKDVVRGIEEPAVAAIFAFPVIDAAVGDISWRAVVVNPNFLSRQCVQGHRGVILPHHVHDPVDHQRVEAEAKTIVARGVKPHLLQLGHVRLVDLRQGRVLRRVGAALVVTPRGVRLVALGPGLDLLLVNAGNYHRSNRSRSCNGPYRPAQSSLHRVPCFNPSTSTDPAGRAELKGALRPGPHPRTPGADSRMG